MPTNGFSVLNHQKLKTCGRGLQISQPSFGFPKPSGNRWPERRQPQAFRSGLVFMGAFFVFFSLPQVLWSRGGGGWRLRKDSICWAMKQNENHMAVGQNQWDHFGVGAPPILVYFSGDRDVHWGYVFFLGGSIPDVGQAGASPCT